MPALRCRSLTLLTVCALLAGLPLAAPTFAADPESGAHRERADVAPNGDRLVPTSEPAVEGASNARSATVTLALCLTGGLMLVLAGFNSRKPPRSANPLPRLDEQTPDNAVPDR